MNIKKKFTINTYNVGFIKKTIDELMINAVQHGDITWMVHPYKDRFFADPFLWYQDNNYYYVLVEEYLFWEEKGKITLLTVSKKDFKLIERKVIIEEPTHLSFPFCNENEDIITPESVNSGKCISYYIDKKTHKIKEKKLVLNKGLIDQIFVENSYGKWCLTSTNDEPKSKLFMYKLGENGEMFETIKNPVLKNISSARSAGRMFKWNNKLYRPVQDCRKCYGHQIKILNVKNLSDCGYETEEVLTLNSGKNPPFNETMHTFNVYKNIIIVDGSYNDVRPMKLLYKKFPKLFKE